MASGIFVTIPDHGVTVRSRYKLCDLLGTVLLTFMCNGEGYVDMSCFAATRAREYGMFEGCETSPSPDTSERLMSSVDPEAVEKCLREYGRQLVADLSGKQVAMDGKKLRGTNPMLTGNNGLYLMNAFVTENEIVAIPRVAYYNMLTSWHWKIENNLHWHLDVTFGEDACRARKKYAPQNLSLIRKMALQGIKSSDDKRRSVRKRMFQALLQKDYLDELIKSCQF